jgi:O-antigen ligase
MSANVETGERVFARYDAKAWLFLAYLLVAWITLRPFGDLGGAETLELASGKDFEVNVVHALFAAALLYCVFRSDRPALKTLADPFFIALGGWIGVTSLLSHDPATSFKRMALFLVVSAAAAALFLLPRGKTQLAELLAVAAVVVLGLSYFGVVFLPHLAVHQPTDIWEPQLAGDWRGVFGHKNLASQTFSSLAFVGLFVYSAGRRWLGAGICFFSLLFVLNSGGKSSTVICLVAIAISLLARRLRPPALFAAAVFGPLALLNLLGVGSVLSPQLASLVAALPIDASFTGRTDIWRFAAGKAAENPIFGYGFSAFWNTESLRFGGEDATQWATQASHAHNAYLDAALGMGLPGLGLTLLALALRPALDLRRALDEGRDAGLTLMFSQIWIFYLYLASFESGFFNRADPGWLTFLFAVFGLRYLSAFDVKN